MELDEMEAGLLNLEHAIDYFEHAGEPGIAEMARATMRAALDRFEAEGGDRTMFDAAIG
jgi:hypothetical protein